MRQGRPYARFLVNGLCAAALGIPFSAGLAQSQDVTTVAPVTISPMVPVPDIGDGAPYFPVDDIQATEKEAHKTAYTIATNLQDCNARPAVGGPTIEPLEGTDMLSQLVGEYRANQQLEAAADLAEGATRAALEARVAAARGQAGAEAVEQAELSRQLAVRQMEIARDIKDEAHERVADFNALNDLPSGVAAALVDRRTEQRKTTGGRVFVPDAFKDLRLARIEVRQAQEGGLTVLKVSGRIVNPRNGRLSVPPLWISARDQACKSLMVQQYEAPRGQPAIAAHGSLPFAITMKPMPEKTVRTTVTFAPYHREPGYPGVFELCPPAPPGISGAQFTPDPQVRPSMGVSMYKP